MHSVLTLHDPWLQGRKHGSRIAQPSSGARFRGFLREVGGRARGLREQSQEPSAASNLTCLFQTRSGDLFHLLGDNESTSSIVELDEREGKELRKE